jgi:signal transduction histidine kinase
MRRYAAEVFEANGITYTMDIDDSASMSRLNMEKRRDVFFIYKEIINNIHKHAAASMVIIKMHFEGPRLKIMIRDNGRGFDTTAETHRNGLKNLHTRVTKWNGTLEVQSAPGGTGITITI